MKEYCVRSKGFISTYFLYIFMIISFCVLIISKNQINKSETLINIEEYSKHFNNEYIVISYLKDRLLKEEEIVGIHNINDIEVEVYEIGKEIYINIMDENFSTILLILNDEKTKIIDYESVIYP